MNVKNDDSSVSSTIASLTSMSQINDLINKLSHKDGNGRIYLTKEGLSVGLKASADKTDKAAIEPYKVLKFQSLSLLKLFIKW